MGTGESVYEAGKVPDIINGKINILEPQINTSESSNQNRGIHLIICKENTEKNTTLVQNKK